MLPLERVVRQKIDAQLRLAGWMVHRLSEYVDRAARLARTFLALQAPTPGYAKWLLLQNVVDQFHTPYLNQFRTVLYLSVDWRVAQDRTVRDALLLVPGCHYP